MKHKKDHRITREQRRLGILARVAAQDNSDVDGSYTGTPKEGGMPVQDADDL